MKKVPNIILHSDVLMKVFVDLGIKTNPLNNYYCKTMGKRTCYKHLSPAS